MSLSHMKETPQKIPLWCPKSFVKHISFTHDKNTMYTCLFHTRKRHHRKSLYGVSSRSLNLFLSHMTKTHVYMSLSQSTSDLRHHRVMFCGVSSCSLPLQYHLSVVVSRVALFHSNTTYIHVSFTFNERLETPQSGFVWCLELLSSTSTPLIYMSLSHSTSDLIHHRVVLCGVSSRSLPLQHHLSVVVSQLSSTLIPLIRCGVSSRSLPLQYHLYTCLFHI